MSSIFPSHAGFLQFEVVLGDPNANMRKVRSLLSDLEPPPNSILILPELWATGFDYDNADTLAELTPDLLEALGELALNSALSIGGSLIEREVSPAGVSCLYNTFYLVGPDGVLGSYRKQHLFGLWQEDEFFMPGKNITTMQAPWGTVGALVCYDLRFPELARAQSFSGARLILVSAQWPKVRLDHWRTLLQARAIENQVFVVACNSCGITGQQIMGGHSMVIAPDGLILGEAGTEQQARVYGLAEDELERTRSRFCSVGERPYAIDHRSKVLSLEEAGRRLAEIRAQGSTIAFTNGCFDILHSGHAAYLEQARRTADCLVVGLNSDASVRRLKGDPRPINSEADRGRILAALGCVDFVVIFDEDTPIHLIKSLMPDVLIKGADWAEKDIVGADVVKSAGGRVVRVAFEHAVSTSGLISQVQLLGKGGNGPDAK